MTVLMVLQVAAVSFHAPLRAPVPAKVVALSMCQKGEWTPLQDSAKAIVAACGRMSEQVQEVSSSDLLRASQQSLRHLFTGGPLTELQALCRRLIAASETFAPEDQFWLGGPGELENSYRDDTGSLKLPDVPPGTGPYRGAAPHTYHASPDQVKRIAGDGAGSAVTKVAVSSNGRALRACVPRDPSVDLIVVAGEPAAAPRRKTGKGGARRRKSWKRDAGRQGSGAWLVRGPSGTLSSSVAPERRGSGGGGAEEAPAYLRDDMALHADLVYEKLEAGAHLHCCSSKELEGKVEELLSREASFRGEAGKRKLAEWRKQGQWHTECMCAKAAENAAAEGGAPPSGNDKQQREGR